MLFDFGTLKQKYNMDIKGILHIGAHMCEEAQAYQKNGVSNIIWLEANEDLVKQMENKYYVLHACVDSEDNIPVTFNITNNGESSSTLPLGTHLVEHPHIYVTEKREMKTIRIDTLFKQHGYSGKIYNFINLDIQGKELDALKGMGDILDYVDYIYTEVNEKELYVGCALMPDIDLFLSDFTRVETKILNHHWGDALYVRKSKLA